MRTALRRLVGSVAATGPVRRAALRGLSGGPNVVYYHRVGASTPYYEAFDSGCTLERFRRDVDRLSSMFRFASLEEVCAGDDGPRGGRPAVAVTFDDGFRVNSAEMLDLFDRFGIAATAFVTTAFVGNADLMWRNKLSAILASVDPPVVGAAYRRLAADHGLPAPDSVDDILALTRSWAMTAKDDLADELWDASGMPPLEDFMVDHEPYFTWSELENWSDAGHAVGLHTRTHPFCSRLDEAGIQREIIDPARDLRRRLGPGFLPFSYPFGDRLPRTREEELVADGTVDAIFGIDGLSASGTAPARLDRAGLEEMGVDWPIFGRPLANSLVGRVRRP